MIYVFGLWYKIKEYFYFVVVGFWFDELKGKKFGNFDLKYKLILSDIKLRCFLWKVRDIYIM